MKAVRGDPKTTSVTSFDNNEQKDHSTPDGSSVPGVGHVYLQPHQA